MTHLKVQYILVILALELSYEGKNGTYLPLNFYHIIKYKMCKNCKCVVAYVVTAVF